MKIVSSILILLFLSSYASAQSPWTEVTGAALQIAVDPSGQPWVVNDKGYIYKRTSTGFVQLPGLANDIGIGANGDVWVIGATKESGGYGIHHYAPILNKWIKVSGAAVRIAVDPSGQPWVVNDKGYIYKRTSSGFVRLPGLASDIGIGANGDVWIIGTTRESGGYGIYRYAPLTNTWIKVSGAAVRISVDATGNPWVVNDQGYIYRRTPSGFAKVRGTAKDISVGAHGDVWIIGTAPKSGGYGILEYTPAKNPWAQISGAALEIAVSPLGLPWVVNDKGYIYRRTSSGFVQLPGLASDIGIGANGDVWIIGTTQESGGYGIYRYVSTTNTWSKVSGGAVRIAVDPQGNPWIVDEDGQIFKRTSSGFVQLPGLASDIGIGANGDVWIIGATRESGGYGIYQYVAASSTWRKVSGAGVRISVDPAGNPWIVNDHGLIYRRTSSGFVQVPGGGSDISVGANGDVWLIGTTREGDGGYGIYQYVD